MKLDMAAQELRAIRDPRGPDGNEQLAAAVGALDAAILLIDHVACDFPDIDALLSVLQRKERGRVHLTNSDPSRQ